MCLSFSLKEAVMNPFWHALLILGLIDILILVFGYLILKRQWKVQRRKGWVASTFGNEVHVLPQGDLMLHLANDCSCSPRRYPVELPDGSAQWQVVHNALDGRDL